MSRVMVFVDYLNFCQAAREVLGPAGALHAIDPACLAHAVVAGRPDRELAGIRVYRGVPNHQHDPEGHVETYQQIDRWLNAGISVVHRPLEGPGAITETGADISWQQKSLAIRLALDLVVLAWRDHFDIAVLLSLDADLIPALKAVLDHTWKAVELASWRNPCGPSPRLVVPGERLPCHWLDAAAYAETPGPGPGPGDRRRP